MKASDAPVTEGDADFLDRVARHDGPYFCTGYEATRARRLRQIGLLRGGHLGDRYVQLTAAGRHFVQRRNRLRAGGTAP